MFKRGPLTLSSGERPGAERQMAIDVIPILADGLKWLGFLPKPFLPSQVFNTLERVLQRVFGLARKRIASAQSTGSMG